VLMPWLLARGHEPHPSTREHQPTREQTPGCKRSPANGDVRLVILPYGRRKKLDSRNVREVSLRQLPRSGGLLLFQGCGRGGEVGLERCDGLATAGNSVFRFDSFWNPPEPGRILIVEQLDSARLKPFAAL